MDAGFKKIHTLTFLLNKQNTETTIQIVTIRKPHRTIYIRRRNYSWFNKIWVMNEKQISYWKKEYIMKSVRKSSGYESLVRRYQYVVPITG